MDKGTRIRIVKGRKGKGVVGTVFWEGPNKWGEGTRLGIEGDDGQTYWINADNVEELAKTADPGPPPAPELARGDHVSWTRGEDSGTGRVFWVGEGRNGRTRVGVNDDASEETLWFDARAVTVIQPDEAPAAHPGGPAGSPAPAPRRDAPPPPEPVWADGEEAPPPTDDWAPITGEPPPMDEPPPLDYAPIGEDDEGDIPF